MGKYIKSHTTPDESILVWGPKPAVYHLAERRAPTRHVTLLAVAGPNLARAGAQGAPGAMEELQRELRADPPAYIVLVPTLPNYRVEQDHLRWLQDLLARAYVLDRSFGSYDLFRRRPVVPEGGG